VITLFALPKPFVGHVGTIQRNALESWVRLDNVDVVVFGDEEGVAEAAAAVGARHVADVKRNEFGTPLVDSAFRIARKISTERLLSYVNADVMLLPDFAAAVSRIRLSSFLLVGRRWTIDMDERIDFTQANWESVLRAKVESSGVLDPPTGIDYFVFDRTGPLGHVPAFTVGRPGWDNWMIYNARRKQIPVVDGTGCITAIHQRHGYDHVPQRREGAWFGPESDANYALIGQVPHFRTVHATHVLTPTGVRIALAPTYLRHRWRMRHFADGRVERIARLLAPTVDYLRSRITLKARR
jgi:hypothetical protein